MFDWKMTRNSGETFRINCEPLDRFFISNIYEFTKSHALSIWEHYYFLIKRNSLLCVIEREPERERERENGACNEKCHWFPLKRKIWFRWRLYECEIYDQLKYAFFFVVVVFHRVIFNFGSCTNAVCAEKKSSKTFRLQSLIIYYY